MSNSSVYKRSQADTKFDEVIGDIFLSGTFVDATSVLSWGTVVYYIDGNKYTVSADSIDFASEAPGAGTYYIIGYEDGVSPQIWYSAITATDDDEILLATVTLNGSNVITSLVQEVTGTLVSRSGIDTHNSLLSIQGGTSGERYHLTSDEYDVVTGTITNVGTIEGSSAYTASGTTVVLSNNHTTLDYFVDLQFNINTYSEDYSYQYYITNKTLSSFTFVLNIAAEDGSGSKYDIREYDSTDIPGDGASSAIAQALDSITYLTVEKGIPSGILNQTREFEIEFVNDGPLASTTSGEDGGLAWVAFPNATDSDISIQFQVPPGYLPGTPLYIALNWFSLDTNDVSLDYTVDLYRPGTDDPTTAPGDTATGTWTLTPEGANIITKSVEMLTTLAGAVDVTSVSAGDIMNIVILREDSSDPDANTSDMKLFNLSIRY